MPTMDVRDVIKSTKDWIRTTLDDEQVTNLGIEEIYFDEMKNVWKVTVGFSRPWDKHEFNNTSRVFKVVSLDDSYHNIIGMVDRE